MLANMVEPGVEKMRIHRPRMGANNAFVRVTRVVDHTLRSPPSGDGRLAAHDPGFRFTSPGPIHIPPIQGGALLSRFQITQTAADIIV